ncbi:MAG TPA: hypothetical protein VFF19_35725 [Reyranella sp.]|nr:hypothetical protein [Reyranella sp.]
MTSDSSTTIIDFAARASRGLINDAVASAAPPTIAALRPNPLTLIAHPLLINGQRSAIQPKKNGPMTGPFPLFDMMPEIRA